MFWSCCSPSLSCHAPARYFLVAICVPVVARAERRYPRQARVLPQRAPPSPRAQGNDVPCPPPHGSDRPALCTAAVVRMACINFRLGQLSPSELAHTYTCLAEACCEACCAAAPPRRLCPFCACCRTSFRRRRFYTERRLLSSLVLSYSTLWQHTSARSQLQSELLTLSNWCTSRFPTYTLPPVKH